MRPIRYAAGRRTEIVYIRGLQKKKKKKNYHSKQYQADRVGEVLCNQASRLTQYGTELNGAHFDSVVNTNKIRMKNQQ